MRFLNMRLAIFLVLAFATLHVATGAKILGVLTTALKSHTIWNRVLMRALASRGHHLTVLSPEAETIPLPNHRDILIENGYKYKDDADHTERIWEELSSHRPSSGVKDLRLLMCEQNVATNGMKTLMHMKNETFDLIIVEAGFGECFLGLVHHFNYPPVIGVSAYSSPPWASTVLGNIPLPCQFTDRMTFYQRFKNTLLYLSRSYTRNYSFLPAMDEIVRRHFGNSTPSVSEIERHISLILVNSHPSMDYPRSQVPAMIPVGGMHIKPLQPLPTDLQKFIDESPHGVIFFSLGENGEKLGEAKIRAILEAFRDLPQRILWKWESDVLPGQSPNVKLAKWFPQSDILGHPNVRLFISHGGLLSLQEAVYHGVPVVWIGMPFMQDQQHNMKKIVDYGAGEALDNITLTKKSLLDVVTKVINNQSYRENMKKLSELFRDLPEKPLDRAIFWTEYVIRHKGAPHLRSAAADMPWYQFLLLDVVAVFVIGILVVLVTVIFADRAIVRMFVAMSWLWVTLKTQILATWASFLGHKLKKKKNKKNKKN